MLARVKLTIDVPSVQLNQPAMDAGHRKPGDLGHTACLARTVVQTEAAVYCRYHKEIKLVKAVCGMPEEVPRGNQKYVFRPWITTRDGRRIYAKAYGLRAFRIPVGDPEEPNQAPRSLAEGERDLTENRPERA